MDCTKDYAFDECWSSDFTSRPADSSSLLPLPESALSALADAQAAITSLGVGDACWKDVEALGACHPANVSSSEFGAAVGAEAKQAWVPLELSGDGLKASLQGQFALADGSLPPALKYSFFVTGVSRANYNGFPSQYSQAALEFENAWHVAMKEVAAKYPELTISWVGQSQPMTEFAMELFPPMLMCLPLAFTVLIILVVLAFAHHSTDGKLVLPLALADLLDPALVFLVANLAVMATFGISCLLFPYVFFGHIFGASIGLAIGIDGMLVMHSYLRVPLKAGEDPREGFIERFASGAVAVTFTSLSTAIAFLATSISVFRMAIEIGICCAIAVGFNWLYIVTFFGAACAYLDTKPKSDRRFLLQGFFETSVTSVVSSTAGKALIFSVFVALLGGGIASFSKVQKEAGFEPVFDSEASTLVRWQYAAYRHFGDAYTWNATLVLASPDIDYSDAATRSRIDEAVAAVGESEFIDGGSVDSWLSAFLAEGGPLEPSAFYATLATWLTSDSGRRFADDVELAADGASIIASRIRFTQSAAQWGDAFPVYVAAVETTAPFADLDARLFADEYIVYELDEYNKLAGKIAVCVGTAGILVALLLFFHPLVAFVTAVSIFCIELMTVPFVLLGGIRIGPAVVFSAGAAFGLASDNIVHMLHAWSEAVASGHPNPVQSALSLVGHPLLLSGISTAGMFASFMPLVWPVIANIKIAYTLSFIFLAFVSVQLFFGLLLVPAVLHSIGGGGGGGGQAKPAMV